MFSIIYWGGGEDGYIFPLNTTIQKTARLFFGALRLQFPGFQSSMKTTEFSVIFPPHKNITVDLRSWTTGNCFSATWIILLIIIKSKHVFMEQEEVSRIHSRKLANWEKNQPEINNKHIYVLHQCLLLLTIFHILICAARFHSQMLWLKCYFNENFFPTCFHGKTKYASPPHQFTARCRF